MAEIMTVEEVARYLRVNERTIYRLLKWGSIPATKVGHQWRFDKASIDEWLQQKSIRAKANILIVDDEETIRTLFKAILEKQGHRVITARNGSEGLELVKQQDFALVFLDLKMPGMDGAELFRHIKNIKPELPVIITTGYPNSDMMSRALAHGPFGIIKKPFNEQDIIMATNTFVQSGTVMDKRTLEPRSQL